MGEHKGVSGRTVSALPSSDEILASLRGVDPREYGEKYKEHLFEQYKLYLELADKISARRQETNTFCLALSTAFVTVTGFLAGLSGCGAVWPIAVGLAGLALSYTWYRMIRSYRGLSSGKFLVIHALEQLLPMQPYKAEWIAVGEGKNPRLYLPFTHVESVVPWVFFALYSILLLLRASRVIWPGLL
jgi:hypothetical protein